VPPVEPRRGGFSPRNRSKREPTVSPGRARRRAALGAAAAECAGGGAFVTCYANVVVRTTSCVPVSSASRFHPPICSISPRTAWSGPGAAEEGRQHTRTGRGSRRSGCWRRRRQERRGRRAAFGAAAGGGAEVVATTGAPSRLRATPSPQPPPNPRSEPSDRQDASQRDKGPVRDDHLRVIGPRTTLAVSRNAAVPHKSERHRLGRPEVELGQVHGLRGAPPTDPAVAAAMGGVPLQLTLNASGPLLHWVPCASSSRPRLDPTLLSCRLTSAARSSLDPILS
jgi:hypothetical protein